MIHSGILARRADLVPVLFHPFEDYSDRNRHLQRLRPCRPMPRCCANKYNCRIEIGDRGRMYMEGVTLHAPLESA
jgi:hypothetical protein